MNEYDVSFYSTPDGAIAVDIHTSSGMSPYRRFHSKNDVRQFFQSMGVADEKLREVDSICSNLESGHGFHEKMFLPDSVNDIYTKA
jgi:hypothetical protein